MKPTAKKRPRVSAEVYARHDAKRGPGLRPRLSPAAAEIAKIYSDASLRAIASIVSESIVWRVCTRPATHRGTGCALCGSRDVPAECIDWDRAMCTPCLRGVVDAFRAQASK